ncbi:hypothetical protein DPEC_G00298320 [Dallia pectoralis]|uniref:Uncharacterized protein n=1 Tax=Dallia pectoralis TaxID=75939 RepID=A0ACC2FFZ7_DALPE|nr:hypothetical protein DPEC_G00298320 [Dallia pectoralis]
MRMEARRPAPLFARKNTHQRAEDSLSQTISLCLPALARRLGEIPGAVAVLKPCQLAADLWQMPLYPSSSVLPARINHSDLTPSNKGPASNLASGCHASRERMKERSPFGHYTAVTSEPPERRLSPSINQTRPQVVASGTYRPVRAKPVCLSFCDDITSSVFVLSLWMRQTSLHYTPSPGSR